MISGRQKPVPREIIGLLSLVVALPTSAEPIIIEFGGVIDFVEEGLPIADQVALGMPYYALYQFDPVGVVMLMILLHRGIIRLEVQGS